MALQIGGFVTPEQSFNGLNQAANNLERKRYRDEQLAEQRRLKRATTSRFLEGYLNPKEHLSGSPYDPEIAKGFMNLLTEAAELADEGADSNMLMMAMGPKVAQISEYAQKAKLVNARLKDQLQKIKPNEGYDIPALEQEARRMAFYGQDGKLKDISTVDPNVDYLTETVRLHPDKVTTDAGWDSYLKDLPKYTEVKELTTYSPTGTMNKRKAKITAPSWMTQDRDDAGRPTEGLVPKFEIALENGQPLMHEFVGEDGTKTKAPVRLLEEKEFTSLMRSNRGIADWVRGQVKAQLPEGVSMDSPQAKNLARAITYDELNRRKAGSVEDVQVVDKPSSMDFKINFPNQYYKQSSGSGSGGGEPSINDLYGSIKKTVDRFREDGKSKGQNWYTRVSALNSQEQTAVMKVAKELIGSDTTNEDIYLAYDKDGDISIFTKDDNVPRTKLNFTGINFGAQPGVGEKREVVKEGNKEQPKSTPSTNKWAKYKVN